MKKVLSFIAIMFLAFLLIGCGVEATTDGSVQVIVYDYEKEVFNKEVSFSRGNTLKGILEDHEEVQLKGVKKDTRFEISEVIGLGIDEYLYWNIKVDGKDSEASLDKIKLKDGQKIELELIYAVVGSVNVKVYNLETDEVFNSTLNFKKVDTIEGLLKDHAEVQMKGDNHPMFGFMIKELCGINSDDHKNTFWNLKINGEDSMVGISEVELKDRDEISFHLIGW